MWSRPEDYNSEQMITSTLFYGNGLRQLIRDITPHSLFCYHKKGFEAYARKKLVDLSEECFWHQPEDPKYCNWSEFRKGNQKKNRGLEGWVTCDRLVPTISNDDILTQAHSPVPDDKPVVPTVCDQPHRWKEPLNVTFFHFTNTDRFIEQYNRQITYRNIVAHNTKPSVSQERQQCWYRWPASAINRNKDKTLKTNVNNRRPSSNVHSIQTPVRVSSSKEAVKAKPQVPKRPSSESKISKSRFEGQQRSNAEAAMTIATSAKSTPIQLSRAPTGQNKACLPFPVKTKEERKPSAVIALQRNARNVFTERPVTPGTPNDLCMSLSSSNDDLVVTLRQESESSIDTRRSSAESKNEATSSMTKNSQQRSKRLKGGEHKTDSLKKRNNMKRGKRHPSKLVKDDSLDSLEQYFFVETSSGSSERHTCEDSSTEMHPQAQAGRSYVELDRQTKSNQSNESTDERSRQSSTGADRESPFDCSTDENQAEKGSSESNYTSKPKQMKSGPEQPKISLTDSCRAQSTSDSYSLPPLIKLPMLLTADQIIDTGDKLNRLALTSPPVPENSQKNVSLKSPRQSTLFYANKCSDIILEPCVVETRTSVSSSSPRFNLDATTSVLLRRGSMARSLSSPASISRHQTSPKVSVMSRNESTQTPPFFIPMKTSPPKRSFQKKELVMTDKMHQSYFSNDKKNCHISEVSKAVSESHAVNDENGPFSEQSNHIRLWNELPLFEIEEAETPQYTPRNEDAQVAVLQVVQPSNQLIRKDIENKNPSYKEVNDNVLIGLESLKTTPRNHLSSKSRCVDVREFQLISHLFRQQQKHSKDREKSRAKVSPASAAPEFRERGFVSTASKRQEIIALNKPLLGLNFDTTGMLRTSSYREFRLPPPISVVTNPVPSKLPVNALGRKMVKHTNKFTFMEFPQVGGLTFPHLQVKQRQTKKSQKPKPRPRK